MSAGEEIHCIYISKKPASQPASQPSVRVHAYTVCVRQCVPIPSKRQRDRRPTATSRECVSRARGSARCDSLLFLSPYQLSSPSLHQCPAPHRPRRLPFFPSRPSLSPSVGTTVECATTLPRPSPLVSSARRALPLSSPSLSPSSTSRHVDRGTATTRVIATYRRTCRERSVPVFPWWRSRRSEASSEDGDRGEAA